MRRGRTIGCLWLACWTALVSGGETELLDPKNPAEWRAMRDASVLHLSPWPPKRIEQLEAGKKQLLQRLAQLPMHDPQPLLDRLGYHSAFATDHTGTNGGVHNVILDWAYYCAVDSIAFAPAYNPVSAGWKSYAFPKRFKLEAEVMGRRWKRDAATGSWEHVANQTNQWIELANWMEEDFPDPGSYPVFFKLDEYRYKQMVLTVPMQSGEAEGSYFALGEIYAFYRLKSGEMGDNMTAWREVLDIRVSDSLSVPPLWDEAYLRDGAVGFGLPLSEKTGAGEDFMVTFEPDDLATEPVELVLDIGETQKIGRIEFWPAEAPGQMAVPMFGFPSEIIVELSPDPDFKAREIIEVNEAGKTLFHDNLLTIICKGYVGRYIRITLKGLSDYEGKPFLGLGEIVVAEFGKMLSTGCPVRARGIPERYLDQVPRLVDGYSRQRRILSEGEWIKGLSLRRPLDQRLALVEAELVVAQDSWRNLQLRISIAGIVVLIFSLLGVWGGLRLQRLHVLKKLKFTITRDLHDEVGSNLGSISLMADQLRNQAMDADMKEDIIDLSLLAREACASLREVVWVVDQPRIYLHELVKKMVERTERILSGAALSVEVAQPCPNVEVSLVCKRHLLMLYKEAVHNCARHAGASQVALSIAIENEQLMITLSDNGRGFSPDSVHEGWGVKNMRKRAHEMGGTLAIQSEPGRGTELRLSIPFSRLAKAPSTAYSTSN